MRAACDDRQRWLVRLADPAEAAALTTPERVAIEAHLEGCEGCRAALADQVFVAGVLRSRLALRPSPAFALRLAARLDEASGWLGILDWRAWTFRLAPIALALLLVAVFSGTPATGSSAADGGATTSSTTATIDTWTHGVGEPTSVAADVWQDRTSSDALLETMILGPRGASRENANVR